MDKKMLPFLCLLMISTIALPQEHKLDQPKPVRPGNIINGLHLTIDIPERTNHENHTEKIPNDHNYLKRLKVKIAAGTAIVTALITGGVTIYIAINKYK